jgi:sulfate adenylyltransferase
MSILISPYGDRLVNLLADEAAAEELKARAGLLPSVRLSERQACDLELLATGAFSPLDTFLGAEDYARVLGEMRLSGGKLFPIPVTLSVQSDAPVRLDSEVALRDSRNELLAVMRVEEVYEWDRAEAARSVFGTTDARHPVVAEMCGWGPRNISGRLRVIALPRRFDFRELRLTPAETRTRLEALGRPDVVAFQTRNPLHRAHEELTKRAAEAVGGTLLLHPAVGMSRPGDVDRYTRVRTYQVMASNYYERGRVLLSLLPLAMRMAGPREALWHALIRRNYGANHFIVGRDHASPGADSNGRPFYAPYAAQELVEEYGAELGVRAVPFKEVVYLPDEDRYEEASKLKGDRRALSLSGSRAREEYLDRGEPLPGWYTRPEVARILAETYPPRHRQGVCVWFTGLSGAGKSTTAEVLAVLLLERGRRATLLDGDVVRTHLSAGLGFSREDRDANIRRMGFVAAEVVRHGGVCVCAAVSPYRSTRNDVRGMVGTDRFVEVFVDTPLEVCERRDAKGLYARARRGEIESFTGVSDPYEPPQNAEIVLDTLNHPPEENALRIIEHLTERGFVRR